MNFLAHLWLADRAGADLAGAILGDVLRGALPAALPAPVARSVRLHRRIDARTDVHPRVQAARRRFGPGARRWSGVILDVLYDHALALDWARFSGEPLEQFADRAAAAVAAQARWFQSPPRAAPFANLLVSYRDPQGFELAVRRIATRLRKPEALLDAMVLWQEHLPAAREDLPVLLADLEQAAHEFRETAP